jgi:hypothetical protein
VPHDRSALIDSSERFSHRGDIVPLSFTSNFRSACQCRFCRKHGALCTFDLQGEMGFAVVDRSVIIR